MASARGKLTLEEKGWIKYDIANSAFWLLAATLIPIYFSSLAPSDSPLTATWGFAESAASVILALFMPVLGSMADIMGNKKKFLIGMVGTGIVACLTLGVVVNPVLFLAVYIVTSIALNGAEVFYDAFLIDVTTTERRDMISSLGYAWGYIGSCIPFAACLVLVLAGESFGVSASMGMRLSFLITGLWWMGFTIPIVKNVKQKFGRPAEPISFIASTRSVIKTVKYIAKTKHLLMFMLAFFFLIDGVHTVIKMAVIFGTELGLESTGLVTAMIATQVVAFPSSIAYGRLAKKIGAWRMITFSVACYMAIVTYSCFFLDTIQEFWVLAICVGLFQGGIQALTRSYYANKIPPEKSDEMFGIFNIFGKYASALGTFLVGAVSMVASDPHAGIGSLVLVFAIALVFLFKIPKEDR